MYFVRVPKFICSFFPKYIWNVASHQIALTFDDGPNPDTTFQLLDLLKKCNVSSTHFLLGKQVENFPNIFQELKSSGQKIGSHSYSHLNGWQTEHQVYFEDFSKGNLLINSSLFRPPYGKIANRQWKIIQSAHPEMKCCQFNFMPGDFDDKVDTELLKDRMYQVRGGDIVVLHDRPDCWAKYSPFLEQWILDIRNRGLEFVFL